jgi:hypothetical protein
VSVKPSLLGLRERNLATVRIHVRSISMVIDYVI